MNFGGSEAIRPASLACQPKVSRRSQFRRNCLLWKYFAPPLTDLTDSDDTASTFFLRYSREPNFRVEPYSAARCEAKIGSGLDPQGNSVATLLFLARYGTTPSVGSAQVRWSTGPNLCHALRLTDWMKGAGWDDKRIAQEASWLNATFKDFSATANNPTYLGHSAGTAAPR
ncbi:hypothetical protein NRB_00560 [Novosphingobium sp. 11B]